MKNSDSEKTEKPIQYFGRHKKPINRRKIPIEKYIHTPRLSEELILLRKTFQKNKKQVNIELIAVPVKNQLPAFQLWDDGVLMSTLHFLEPAVKHFNAYAGGIYKDDPKEG